MSETEFWGSTAAKVFALKKVQVDNDRRRDYFTAQIAANILNANGTKDSKTWGADDFLKIFSVYRQRSSVMITHDPDRGAIWVGNKSVLGG